MSRPNLSRRMLDLEELEAVLGGEEVLPPEDREPEGGGEGGGGTTYKSCTKVSGSGSEPYCVDWKTGLATGRKCFASAIARSNWMEYPRCPS